MSEDEYEPDQTFTTFTASCPVCDELVVVESRTTNEQIGRTQAQLERKEHLKSEHTKAQMLIGLLKHKWRQIR